MTSEEQEQLIMGLASTYLFHQPELPRSSEIIEQAVRVVAGICPDVDTAKIIRELESRFSVSFTGDIRVLHDDRPEEDEKWLEKRQKEIEWHFWKRYERWLLNKPRKPLPEPTVRGIDEFTNTILGLLEDPRRQGTWDRRGLVVGNVQAGKTANYAGLINKAIDVGYKVIIVLAGMHNSLRSQTQLRLDLDVIGYESQKTRVGDENFPGIGVGSPELGPRCIVHSLTDSSEHGDFNRARANISFTPGGDPVVLVVKKNASVLEHILRWIRSYGSPIEGKKQQRVLRDIPLLVVDDEADNASIDTNSAKRDAQGRPIEENIPARINGLIRKLLCCFEKRAYVGYTATPFANLFIYPTDNFTDEVKFGGDLFPRSFIVNLPDPSDYIGPVQVFGLSDDMLSGICNQEGLPIVRSLQVEEYSGTIPPQHKKEWRVPELPPSLQEAIKVFLLSCAMRRARGQNGEHNSMLIHVTRFTAVQEQIMGLVKEEVNGLRRRIRYGDGNLGVSIFDELRALWENDFIPTTARILEMVDDSAIIPITWTEILPHLLPVAESIEFKLVNGSAKDVLDYYQHTDGMTVIAVGGDKLSRGLTLEGLTVSYFLRASTIYDTLLQMGRWFGYRHGYVDACRLYTSRELVDWYKYITLAHQELRYEFDEMVSQGENPLNFLLKVRSRPAMLQITAAKKLRHSQRFQVTFDNDLVQTFAFHKDPVIVHKNYQVVETWISALRHNFKIKRRNYLWEDVPGHLVVELLERLTIHPHVRKVASGLLTTFITREIENRKLTSWVVVLISNESGVPHRIGDLEIHLTERSDSTPDDKQKYAVTRNNILNPPDQALDLTEAQYDLALQITKQQRIERKLPGETRVPSGSSIRQLRSEQNGLLIIYPLDPAKIITTSPLAEPVMGIALSFPCIDNATPIEYEASSFYKQIFGEDDDL